MYTPIEGGIPQNFLDEFRNISAAFAKLDKELKSRYRDLEERIRVELPEFPSVEESEAFKDLNREVLQLDEIFNEKLEEYNSRIAAIRSRMGEFELNYHLREVTTAGQIEELRGMLMELNTQGETFDARIWQEFRLRVGENSALAQRVSLLEVSGGGFDDTALWAAIVAEEEARIEGDAASASQLTLLGAKSGDSSAFILNTSTVYVEPTVSWASWNTTLQTSLTGKATITQFNEVRDDVDEIYAKAGLQLNVNNHIIGWALHNNGASGDMVIQVDRFFIVTPPGGPGGPTQIFAADATGVYIDTAYIRNLSVDVLSAGDLSVPIELTGSITIPNTGYIRSGQTAWNVGTGWWMGHEGGVPKFSLGDSTGQRLTWSAATGLQITGAITLTSPIPSGDVSGLGSLATQSTVSLTTQVTNKSLANLDSTANTKLSGIAAGADVTLSAINGGLTVTGGGINLASGTSSIRSGQTAYNTGNGWWLGRDNVNGARFSIGNGTNNYMRWDGTALRATKAVIDQAELHNSPLTTSSARIHTGGGRTAPFSIYDVNQVSITGSVEVGGFQNPGNGTGHNFKRLAYANQDALIQAAVVLNGDPGETPSQTIVYLDYRTNGGSWIQVRQLGALLGNSGTTAPVTGTYVARFTTPNTWNTLDLRVRAANTNQITMSVFFNNANQSDPVNAGTGGDTATPPLAPPLWEPPPGSIIS